MRGLGASAADIAAQRARWEAAQPEPEPVEVFPENIPAFRVLIATADQWEYPTAFGGRLVLPLSEIKACMDLLELPCGAKAAMRVMTMVRAAREVLRERFQQSVEQARARAKRP